MNKILLKKYIKKLSKAEIKNIALKYNIKLNNIEIDYIKKLINKDYNEYEVILDKLKEGLTPSNYLKIYNLYKENKDKLP